MALLNRMEVKKLEAKIAAAEKLTSAEFKVIICNHAWFGLRKKAIRLFRKYQLDETQDRNAVLFLIVEKDRQLIIYGDEGIHEKTGTTHWEFIRDRVIDEFRTKEFYRGTSMGIHLIAQSLIEHFPAAAENENEVSNAVIFE